jgi:hypothetical protein
MGAVRMGGIWAMAAAIVVTSKINRRAAIEIDLELARLLKSGSNIVTFSLLQLA